MSDSLVEYFMALENKIRLTYGVRTEFEKELDDLRGAILRNADNSKPMVEEQPEATVEAAD